MNLSQLADQPSFKEQLTSLQKILDLLEEDKTPTSRWSAVVNKEALAGGTVVLKEYLPLLQEFINQRPEATVAPDQLLGSLVKPIIALGQVADKLSQGKQVFIGLNYGAQRTKKQAFEDQVERNLVYSNSRSA